MALGATGSAWAAGYKAGTYQASAQGMGGPVKVEVEFTSSAIKAVRIVGTTKETPGIGTTALEKLPPLIVENQSLGIDAITGASKSSSAVLTAVAPTGSCPSSRRRSQGTDGCSGQEVR